jgi:outer membrane protein assembly factor BamA
VGQVFPYKTDQLPGDPKALADAIRRAEPLFQDKMPATEPVLKRVSKLVESELAKSGKSESVSGQVSAEEQGTLMIVFRPSTLPSVAEVKFEGNKAVPTAKLQLAVVGVAVGALWSEPRFQTILDASVRPVYEEMGRIRVSFPKLVAEPAKDVKGLIVTVTVNEGEVYKLRNVELTGAADPRPLLKEAKFSTEEVANFTEIGNSVEKIRQNLKRNGYLKVQTAVERKIDDKAKTVDLLVKLTPGPQFHFGKLKIEGLDIQTEPHVRKLWAMKPGQAYNYEYADVFLSRIRQDGMFDNLGETKSVPTIDEAGKTVDVTLLFHSDGRPAPAIGPAQEEREKRRRQPGDGPPL